jgi:hypothetical protein
MRKESFITLVPAQGAPYSWWVRSWNGELLAFLENEARAAEPRLSPERIDFYRRTARTDDASRLLAAVQLEAAGWIGADGRRIN